MMRILLYLLAIICLFVTRSQATTLTYMVEANDEPCFHLNAAKQGQKISFYFAVQSGGSFDIDFSIRDPKGNIVQSGEQERQGDYVFAASMPGEYSFCFSNEKSSYTAKLVDFDITMQDDESGLKAQLPISHKQDSASDHDITPLESSLFKIGGSLSDISRNQKYIRTRENRNFETVLSTESRIFWFAIFESILIVGISVLQVFVVKTFFKSSGVKGRI